MTALTPREAVEQHAQQCPVAQTDQRPRVDPVEERARLGRRQHESYVDTRGHAGQYDQLDILAGFECPPRPAAAPYLRRSHLDATVADSRPGTADDSRILCRHHPAPPNRATVLLRWMVVCPGTAAHRHRLLDRIGKALTLARLRTDSRTSPRPSERVDFEVAGNPQDVPLEREGDVASRRVADGLAHGAGGRHARSRSAARALRPHASRRPPPFASPHRCKRRSSRPRRGSRAHASSCVRIHNARRDRGVDPSRGLFQQHACGSTSRSPHGSVQPACKARPGDDVP